MDSFRTEARLAKLEAATTTRPEGLAIILTSPGSRTGIVLVDANGQIPGETVEVILAEDS